MSDKSDKEKIKKEIKNLKAKVDDGSSYSNGWKQALTAIEIFIDSLPKEPASEDLEEEIENYIKNSLAIKFPTTDKEQIKADVRYIARHFAEWQRKKDQKSIKLVEEPDLDKAAKEHAANLYGEDWMKHEHVQDNGFKAISNFKFGAEWQKAQDESRRKANIALANTDVPKDKDLDIAFEDIWSDVENYISESYNLSDEQKCKLKNAHHDTFEAGAIWQRKKDQETIELCEDHAMLAGMMKEREEMMKDAVIAWVNTYESVTNPYDNEVSFITNLSPSKFKNKETVKIIIIKED